MLQCSKDKINKIVFEVLLKKIEEDFVSINLSKGNKACFFFVLLILPLKILLKNFNFLPFYFLKEENNTGK